MIGGMTRSGSAAANGIAPSVMNEAPSSHAAFPFSRSAALRDLGRSTVATARASGGTIPAAMTVAMIRSELSSEPALAADNPATAKA